MHVLIINFALNGLSHEAYTALCAQKAPHFAMLPGLISKLWLADAAANTYGGVYVWATRADLEAYLESPTFQALVANPYYANVSARAFATLDEANVESAGPLVVAMFSPLAL